MIPFFPLRKIFVIEHEDRRVHIEEAPTAAVVGHHPAKQAREGIVIDRENGILQGAADPRREGYAVGW